MNKRQTKKFKYLKAGHRRYDTSRKAILETHGDRLIDQCVNDWNLTLKGLSFWIDMKLSDISWFGNDALRAIHDANMGTYDDRMRGTFYGTFTIVGFVIEPSDENYKSSNLYVLARGANDDGFHMYSIIRIRKFHKPRTIMKRSKMDC